MPALEQEGIRVIVIAPDSKEALGAYRDRHGLIVPMISDAQGTLLSLLGQQVQWWKFGRLPATLAVRGDGQVVWRQVGRTMRDIPDFSQARTWFGGEAMS